MHKNLSAIIVSAHMYMYTVAVLLHVHVHAFAETLLLYCLDSRYVLSSSIHTKSDHMHSSPPPPHSQVSSVKQVIKHTAARMSRPVSSAPRLEFHGKSRSRSPSPVNHTPINHPLQMPDDVPSKKGRGRVIGSMKKDLVKSTSKEMRENPKVS